MLQLCLILKYVLAIICRLGLLLIEFDWYPV